MKLEEIPVQILSLKEGDILVLRCPAEYTEEQRYYLGAPLYDILHSIGKKTPIAVISDDVSLAVVREEGK